MPASLGLLDIRYLPSWIRTRPNAYLHPEGHHVTYSAAGSRKDPTSTRQRIFPHSNFKDGTD